MKIVRTLLSGLGTVNLGFLKLLSRKKAEINAWGVEFKIIGVADSSGIAINDSGFNASQLIRLKTDNQKVSQLEGFQPGLFTENLPEQIIADLLIESTPANMETGNPGLETSHRALANKCSVVLANKAPLIFAFDALRKSAAENQVRLKYSSTVCGGLPVINVLTRDLKTASLKKLQGVFNATSNYVLQELENGNSIDEAVKEAQRLGAAEANPDYDLSGQDSANKLFIIMKSFTDFSGSIRDISIEGIMGLDSQKISRAKAGNSVIKLIATAELNGSDWKLTVAPESVSAESFLGSIHGWEMGLQIETDLYDKIFLKNYEAEPLGTSAAVLRDALDIVTE